MTENQPVTHDILNCLANLSNDEVFTPPELANKMIDLLPADLFDSPETTFLDPCCKSGVFLREIAKRLIASPKHQRTFEKSLDQNLSEEEKHQKRLDHIYHRQLFRHRHHPAHRADEPPDALLLEISQHGLFDQQI